MCWNKSKPSCRYGDLTCGSILTIESHLNKTNCTFLFSWMSLGWRRLKHYLSLCTKGIRLLRSSKCEGQVLWFSESSAIKWFLVIIQNFKIRTNCGTFIFKVLAWVLGWHSSSEPPYFKNLSQLLSPSATQQVSDVKSK